MKKLSFALVLIVTLMSLSACADHQKEKIEAQQVAVAWLELVDSGEYSQSLEETADVFKGAITADKWTSMIGPLRTSLGKVLKRELKKAKYAKTLPGAPDGEYVIIQYNTVFENKQTAIETVTPMRGKDGNWRVAGYFIK